MIHCWFTFPSSKVCIVVCPLLSISKTLLSNLLLTTNGVWSAKPEFCNFPDYFLDPDIKMLTFSYRLMETIGITPIEVKSFIPGAWMIWAIISWINKLITERVKCFSKMFFKNISKVKLIVLPWISICKHLFKSWNKSFHESILTGSKFFKDLMEWGRSSGFLNCVQFAEWICNFSLQWSWVSWSCCPLKNVI